MPSPGTGFFATFIRRPVATTLLTLAMALAGLAAFPFLPVAPLPQVDYPTISVSASLPGASPETMAATVATPLERALGRIAGVTEMTSSSSQGTTRVTLQFDLAKDINTAAREVQAAINAARSQLPSSLPNNPTYRKVNPADAPVMILSLTSDTLGLGQLFDAASTVIAQKLSQVRGVGQVNIGGSSLPAVRVELNPTILNAHGISFDQVRQAITTTNVNRPKGMVEDGDRHWMITANDQATRAADYAPVIVTYRNGAAVRIRDLADEVVDSVQDLRNFGSSNGKPAVTIVINRQPGANIVEVVDRINALLPFFRASIPAQIDLQVTMERTSTIRASLREVRNSLVISIALVIMVVFLFLRNARATLIPAVAVPVSLVATFGVMYLAGFSLNNLTLMALTVATGFVVDDAIVVLENIARHIEEGMKPLAAALRGVREVGFTVVSMSISLVAVFIPILAMGGIVGRLFREFAVTLSVAVLVSLVVSLTMTPMMCGRLLKPIPRDASGARRTSTIGRWSDRAFGAVAGAYRTSLAFALRHSFITLLVLAGTVALNVHLYGAISKGFFPTQDTGRILGGIQGDQASSFQAMRDKVQALVEIVRRDPAVESVNAFTGGGNRNGGFISVSLKPLAERGGVTAERVIARLRPQVARVPGVNLWLFPQQDIRIGGRPSNALYQFTLQADDLDELRAWGPRIRAEMARLPELVDVNTDQEERGLQMSLVIDRDTAARLGVTARMIDQTLANAFGQTPVSTIYAPLNQYRVILEAAPRFWQSPDVLKDVYIQTGNTPGASAGATASTATTGGTGGSGLGTLSLSAAPLNPTPGRGVPLSAFSRFELTTTPLSVNHQGQFAATTISFNVPPGGSLSSATDAVRTAMARLGVPTSVHGTFQGTARAFQASLDSQPVLIITALLAIYIVLGVLYESFVHPITILSTLPSAGIGALLALMAFGRDLDIIAFIGVILLIGIVKKNAIIMIDFALQAERERGLAPAAAILEAAVLRFRPIMMTTLAALLGALPLALGVGDGAELRQPLGISIVGGLVVSQLLTLYTTPVVYLYLDRLRHWALRTFRRGGRDARLAGESA
jgi:multidrug efflux pump